jgi:hypothetical protein
MKHLIGEEVAERDLQWQARTHCDSSFNKHEINYSKPHIYILWTALSSKLKQIDRDLGE